MLRWALHGQPRRRLQNPLRPPPPPVEAAPPPPPPDEAAEEATPPPPPPPDDFGGDEQQAGEPGPVKIGAFKTSLRDPFEGMNLADSGSGGAAALELTPKRA